MKSGSDDDGDAAPSGDGEFAGQPERPVRKMLGAALVELRTTDRGHALAEAHIAVFECALLLDLAANGADGANGAVAKSKEARSWGPLHVCPPSLECRR